jgi:hypothetical protein
VCAKLCLYDAGVHGTRCAALVLCVGCAAGISRLVAQNQPRLFLSLTDPTDKPITDLKGSEVVLRQGDSHCADVRLDPVNWPTRLTVILDNGVNMANGVVELRNGLRAFFAGIPDGIELSIVTMAPQPRYVVRPTMNRDAVLKGIDLVAPDRGAPKFLDSLMEAADRIDKDKTDNFPIIVAIASDLTEGSNAKEQDLMRMLDRLVSHPATVHVLMLSNGPAQTTRTLSGANASEVAGLVAKDTGGVYTLTISSTRLVPLLSDLAHKIAHSVDLQTHQYRVGCNKWDGPVSVERPFVLGAARSGGGSASSTTDGHLP